PSESAACGSSAVSPQPEKPVQSLPKWSSTNSPRRAPRILRSCRYRPKSKRLCRYRSRNLGAIQALVEASLLFGRLQLRRDNMALGRRIPRLRPGTVNLLFDLDGTLTDPLVGIGRCIQHAMSQLGREVPALAELSRFVGPPLRGTFAEL